MKYYIIQNGSLEPKHKNADVDGKAAITTTATTKSSHADTIFEFNDHNIR